MKWAFFKMKLLEQFADIVGPAHVLTQADATAPYLLDWRGRYHGAARCVLRPASTSEVMRIAQLCAQAGVAMVPQGGNTSHCGAGIPDASGDAVLISLARLNKIRSVDTTNNTMTLEAGCILQNAQQAAFDAGRLFPLSLAAEGSCQIGGNLSTNAGGVQVLRYGNMRELTLGLEVVLPSGELWEGLRGLRKDNTGYDLKQLFIGAEGTLGIITAAVLKLFPLPSSTVTSWLALASLRQAITVFSALQERFGAALTACELVSDVSLALVLKHIPNVQRPFSGSPWYLLVELSGFAEEENLRAALERFLEKASTSAAIENAVLAQSREQARRLWTLRESISEAQKIEGVSIKHDISLPISRLAEFVERADAALTKAFPGIRIVSFGHVGDGNLHYNQSKPAAADNAAFVALSAPVNRIVHDLVHELGGSLSAEHGIGQLKREEMRRYKSPAEMAMMRLIKDSLDPDGLMNPGKIL